jgi:microcystin-dependent protein
MAQPYVGEIRMFAGNFAPAGWMLCQGQVLPISENEVLFNLIGTTYGGDGQSTFALPDLQSRVPIHMGTGGGGTYNIGENGGVESVTLTTQQIPSHNHLVTTTAQAGTSNTPNANNIANEGPAGISNVFSYLPFSGLTQVQLNPNTIGTAGGSQPHDNIQPILAINYIISLFGIYPSAT